jgi:TonB-linked SusC/RagA family outer membrane protein
MLNCYIKRYFTTLILIVLLLAHNSAAHAQIKSKISPDSLKGVVLDEYGQPIENVKIIEQGNHNNTTTGHTGNFEIAAGASATLFFSAPGFYLYKLSVMNHDPVTVKLKQMYLQQPDTLDVLYDQVLADNSLGSISTIYTSQLTTTPADNYAVALTGRLAGLYTQQYNGFPLGSTSATLGTGLGIYYTNTSIAPGYSSQPDDNTEIGFSVRGQNPVVVVDGIQRDFFSLDPEDIASVSLLKDGLSTLLLGQMSSNPVLLITTKRAQPGAPRISFTAQTGLETPVALPKPLSAFQYGYLFNESKEDAGEAPLYTAAQLQEYQDGSNPIAYPNVNWFNTVLNKYAPISRYNLMIGGGSTFATYNVSLGYFNQQGLFKSTNPNYNSDDQADRYLINTNVEIKPAKNFTIGLQLLGRIENSTQPGAGSATIWQELFLTPNAASPVFNPNGSPGGAINYYPYNVYDRAENSGYINTYAKDVVADLDLRYNFTDWLPGLYFKAKGNFSYISENDVNRGQTNAVYSYSATDTTYTNVNTASTQSNAYNLITSDEYIYGQAMLGYNGQFGKNSINASTFADIKSVTLNFQLPFRTTNYALNGEYSYDHKYFAQGVIDYSGYSQFAPGKQFGFFYGGGLGWKISNEDFIKDNASWINLLKLRATYAKTGNDNVGYFIYQQSWNPPNVLSSASYNFGSGGTINFVDAITENALANSGVTWEKANKFDLGLDMAFLNNHLQVTADYYNDRYYDLMELPPDNVLIGDIYNPINIGINRYWGFEFSATYQNKIGGLNYFITGNLSLASSKVIYDDEPANPNPNNVYAGQPVGALLGYVANGLYQTGAQATAGPQIAGYTAGAGDIRYEDLGGPTGKPDGVITSFDEVNIGQKNPLVFYGATIGFSYKNFDMSILVQGLTHSKLYLPPNAEEFPYSNTNLGTSTSYYAASQAYTWALGRWTPETASTATFPELNINNIPYNTVTSSYWVRSGDYICLKNLDFGYTLPSAWAAKLKVGSIRVFANCENLFTLSQINLEELEQIYTGTGYPVEKVYNIGFNVKF